MKSYKLIIFILIVFFKTGNVLSDTNIFNVNNIEVETKFNDTNKVVANLAIKKGFAELLNKILLKEDLKKIEGLKDSTIKELVTYYQVSSKTNESGGGVKVNFNISFDKDKVHDLFYKKNISYSKILNKELNLAALLA